MRAFFQVLEMTDKLGDTLSLKLSRKEPAVYGDSEDQVNTRYKHHTLT